MSIKVKHRNGLGIKLIASIIFVAVLASVMSILIGKDIYWNDIVNIYNDKAHEIAGATQGIFTEEDLRYYADMAVKFAKGQVDETIVNEILNSDRYEAQQAALNSLRSSMNLNDIYVAVYDIETVDAFTEETYDARTWRPLIYLFDSYFDPEGAFLFGAASPVDKANKDMLREKWINGEQIDEDAPIITYFEASSTWILTGARYAIYNGQAVAMIGVEVPIPTLQADMQLFVAKIIKADILMLLFVIIISALFFIVGVIRPIKMITASSEKFIENNTEVSVGLDKIKTHDEIQTLSESLLKLEYDMKDYIENITAMTAEKERVGAELAVAARMQHDIMPRDFPKRDDIMVYADMIPAREMGGDFYDFFMIDDDHMGLVMADVSGKGIPAAMFMIVAKTLIKIHMSMPGFTPAEVLRDVNYTLYDDNPSNLFVTAWFGILEISTGSLIYANAGHEYLAIRHSNCTYALIKSDNMPPLAAVRETEYYDETLSLRHGDQLFLYTDGITDAKNEKGERFGLNGMLRILNDNTNKLPEELLAVMKSAVDEYSNNNPFDDITMMSIIWNGK